MDFRRGIASLFLMLFFQAALAQGSKLKPVSEEELKMTVYAKDSAAPAIYLNKYRETYFDYTEEDGFIIVNEYTERIKILNKTGLDYATKKISSYKRDQDKELITEVWGKTHNLENGTVDIEKLEKSAIFEREVSEHFDETAFTMPNVQVGSVVEWGYKLISPFYKIDDLILQEDIPVVDYYARIATPSPFTFSRMRRGFFDIKPEEKVEHRTLSMSHYQKGAFGYSTHASRYNQVMSFTEIIAEYKKNDIPALKEEPYIDNLQNYRMSIVYELVSTEFQKGEKKEYATTWEKVAESIFKHPDFGPHLENTSYLFEIVKDIKENNTTDEAKIDAALQVVKSKLTWNGEYRVLVDNNLRKVLKEGVGNSAEINLILVALLRECGFEANPVVISTKSNGLPLFPTLEGFNYVIAGIRSMGKTLLLDATEPLSAVNILPGRVYNWTGRMINKNGISQEINLYETVAPSSETFVTAQLQKDGSLEGSVLQRLVSLEALNFRQAHALHNPEEWRIRELTRYGLESFNDYELKGLEKFEEPLYKSFSFNLDKAADQVGDKLFISPLIFLKLNENPFKSEVRQYPINFDYPFVSEILVNIQIPEEYQVVTLPKDVNLAIPFDAGNFTYTIKEQEGGMLQAKLHFEIKQNLIPTEYYQLLKEFYRLRIEKENEKVVLEKV